MVYYIITIIILYYWYIIAVIVSLLLRVDALCVSIVFATIMSCDHVDADEFSKCHISCNYMANYLMFAVPLYGKLFCLEFHQVQIVLHIDRQRHHCLKSGNIPLRWGLSPDLSQLCDSPMIQVTQKVDLSVKDFYRQHHACVCPNHNFKICICIGPVVFTMDLLFLHLRHKS